MVGNIVDMKFASDMEDLETFFLVRFHTFEVVDIFKAKLSEVATNYENEGLRSKDEFVARWNQLYPNKPYDLEEKVWVHEFKLNSNVIIDIMSPQPDGDQI
jgi:hypothetical protein